jgi:hypothetical protein
MSIAAHGKNGSTASGTISKSCRQKRISINTERRKKIAVEKNKTGRKSVPSASRALVITRVFDAPRPLVWKAWTDPNHPMRWWGQIIFKIN